MPVEVETTGPAEVKQTCPVQYKTVVYYDNGQNRDVTDLASWWVEPNTFASIEAGLLQTEDTFIRLLVVVIK